MSIHVCVHVCMNVCMHACMCDDNQAAHAVHCRRVEAEAFDVAFNRDEWERLGPMFNAFQTNMKQCRSSHTYIHTYMQGVSVEAEGGANVMEEGVPRAASDETHGSSAADLFGITKTRGGSFSNTYIHTYMHHSDCSVAHLT